LDPALEAAQVARVAETRAKRDGSKTRAALDALSQSARGTDNLMPPILAAVKARATLGEIADVLRNTFGEYRPA
jgi:methylmalonyl-CoA mutase N-terminal domain/subunit